MPLYEYECEKHGTFERLYKREDRPEYVSCFSKELTDCPNICKIQISAPSMQPDKHWAGTKTHSGKTVFSKSEYEEDNKYLVPATEGNVNAVRKKVVEVKQERRQKHERRLDHFLNNELRGVTVEPDGNTVGQKNKFNKMRHG